MKNIKIEVIQSNGSFFFRKTMLKIKRITKKFEAKKRLKIFFSFFLLQIFLIFLNYLFVKFKFWKVPFKFFVNFTNKIID